MKAELPMEVIDLINRIGYSEIYPTGSRYMGFFRPDSDWDFVAQYSNSLYGKLIRMGFCDITQSAGNNTDDISGRTGTYARGADGYTARVMEYRVGANPDGSGGHLVQIQLTSCLTGKLFARDVISSLLADVHKDMDSKKRGELWKRLIDIWAELHPGSFIDVEYSERIADIIDQNQ